MLQEWIEKTVFSPPKEAVPDLPGEFAPRNIRFYTDYELSFLIWGIRPGETVLHTYRYQMADGIGKCQTYPFTDGSISPLHQVSYIELTYIVSGTYRRIIADKEITFHKDDIVIMHRELPYSDRLSSEGCVVLFLNISLSLFEHLFAGSPQTRRDPTIDLLLTANAGYSHLKGTLRAQIGGDSQTSRCLETILQEATSHTPGAGLIIQGQLIRIFHIILREYNIDLPSYQQKDLRRLLYEEILQTIQADCRNTTIESLQARFFYSRDYFTRLIREFSGQTFRELRQEIRLTLAAQLLLETDNRIEDITKYVGYENLTFFYRIFEQRFGQTPRAYRLLSRGAGKGG